MAPRILSLAGCDMIMSNQHSQDIIRAPPGLTLPYDTEIYRQNSSFPAAFDMKFAQLKQAHEQHAQNGRAQRKQESNKPTSVKQACPKVVPPSASPFLQSTVSASEHVQIPFGADDRSEQIEHNSQKGEEDDASGEKKKFQMQTIAMHLELLSHEDPACIFVVRRINKLGFKAAKKLQTYFSSFGEVERILVAHSTAMHNEKKKGWLRRRVASMCFVLMRHQSAVCDVLNRGPEHEVDNVGIIVLPWKNSEEFAQEEDAASDTVQPQKASDSSTTSTLASTASSSGCSPRDLSDDSSEDL